MRTEAPVTGQNRPPNETAVGHTGASVRPTARVRPVVPVCLSKNEGRFHPSDPYVRRFWVAAIGPSAVAELLRLVRAAGKGEHVRLPRHLPILIRAGLAAGQDGCLVVDARFPAVPIELRWRFPPGLAAEHSRLLAGTPPASGG